MNRNWARIVNPSGISITETELQNFEAELRFLLPSDYRNFLLKINGGAVTVDHDIPASGSYDGVYIHYLYPLTAGSPFLGVKEARKSQEISRLCLRQAVEIGDDMGSGVYYLILDGRERGAIYFIFGDERESLSAEDWERDEVRMPTGMIKVSQDFDSLADAIIEHAIWNE